MTIGASFRGFGWAVALLAAPSASAQPAQADRAPIVVTGQHGCAAKPGARHPDLACLNARLAATARSGAADERAAPPAPLKPDAAGLATHAGTAVQLGGNFGRSAFPQRPRPAVLPNPLLPRARR